MEIETKIDALNNEDIEKEMIDLKEEVFVPESVQSKFLVSSCVYVMRDLSSYCLNGESHMFWCQPGQFLITSHFHIG